MDLGLKLCRDWAKQNQEIMIDFARDHKHMPNWAFNDFEPSGIKGDIEWDGQGGWKLASSNPADTGNMHSKFNGVISYRVST